LKDGYNSLEIAGALTILLVVIWGALSDDD